MACMLLFYPFSCGQHVNHGQNPVGHALPLGVNFGQRAPWLEDVEVAVKGYFVTHFGLFWVNPSIGAWGSISRLT